jgi:hypothetical protein
MFLIGASQTASEILLVPALTFEMIHLERGKAP